MGRQVSSARNRPFTVKIILPFDETVKIADVVTSMSILALKDRVELVTGIPRYDFRKYKVNAIQKEAIRTSPAGLATLLFVWIGSVSKEDLVKRCNQREGIRSSDD